jgi:hypothetical protein
MLVNQWLLSTNGILHLDGDSFFVSCETALHPKWQEPVWHD